MWSIFTLLMIMQSAETTAPAQLPKQPCRDIVGGTGGVHLIKRDCPDNDRIIREGIATMTRNGKLAGRDCVNGMAYLRSGGNVERLEDYACAPEQGHTSPTR